MESKNPKQKAIKAALTLAAEKGWQTVTMTDIAARADIAMADLSDYFDDKLDILVAYGRLVDRKVLENIGATNEASDPRDRLFDLLMERFDVLNENRDGIKAILETCRYDPKQAIIGLPNLGRSMSWMLDASGIGTSGIKGAVKVAALAGLYLRVLWVWQSDDSPDMGKTMAALDQHLDRAERWAGSLGL